MQVPLYLYVCSSDGDCLPVKEFDIKLLILRRDDGGLRSSDVGVRRIGRARVAGLADSGLHCDDSEMSFAVKTAMRVPC